jgi:hypothetical protein
MASTPSTPGAYDALEKALPGEPMFPLLGRDPCAPAAITNWCHLRRNRAFKLWGHSANPRDKELLAAELRQCANAEAVAIEFGDFHSGLQEVAGERASYQAVIKSAEEQAAAVRRDLRKRARASLSEAAYYVQDAREAMEQLGDAAPVADTPLEGLLAGVHLLLGQLDEQRAGAQLQLEGGHNG